MTSLYSPEEVWSFETARFRVALRLEPVFGYEYDGDDEDGSTQAALDAGDLVAFDSTVVVYLDGEQISAESLGSNVYQQGEVEAFWQAHRTSSA